SFSSLATFFHCSSFVDLSLSPIYLHSFPTRRSSDLSILGLKSPLPGQAGGQQRLLLVGIAAGIGELQPFGGAFAQFEAQAAGQIDRKSTRLNSSHVSISYAVFCLKKKNFDSVSHIN